MLQDETAEREQVVDISPVHLLLKAPLDEAAITLVLWWHVLLRDALGRMDYVRA